MNVEQSEPTSRPDYAQYIICVVMVAVGAFLIVDALRIADGFAKAGR